MELGIIGLGRMGLNMGTRLIREGHAVTGYDLSPAKQSEAEERGLKWKSSVEDLVESLSKPKTVWIMVPAGKPVDDVITMLLPGLSPGDVIIDGGNSYFKDSIRRAEELSKRDISFLDCGTSGGIWGLDQGYCLMIGGDPVAYQKVEPVFRTLAAKDGYRLVGPPGAGHYLKMVHNGIEYGMLEAYGEGFEILHTSPYDYDLHTVSHLWNQGSVVRSWLLELAEAAFKGNPDLEGIAGYVEDSGEGRWTVFQAIDQDVPAPLIALSLMARFRSRQTQSFSAKVIAALRQEFGGHKVMKE